MSGISQVKSVGEAEDLEERIEEHIDLLYARDRVRTMVQQLENLKKAQDAPRCQHLKTSGDTCGSPAMNGQTYCHYHAQALTSTSLEIPMIEYKRSFQVAMMRVCQQIASGAIPPAQAKVLLQALTVAGKAVASNLG